MTARLSILVVLFLLLAVPTSAQSATDSGTATDSGRRQTLKERVRQRQEEAASKAAGRREAFKEKVATIRDAKKKAIVERADKRIQEINTKRTEQMAEFLARLTKIVEKIESRIAKAKANGKDVSKAEAALTEAKLALNAAKTAVEGQAGKTYTIEVTDEAGLKSAVGAAMASLEKDLRATRKTVVDAKQAVQKVMSLIKAIRGVDDVE